MFWLVSDGNMIESNKRIRRDTCWEFLSRRVGQSQTDRDDRRDGLVKNTAVVATFMYARLYSARGQNFVFSSRTSYNDDLGDFIYFHKYYIGAIDTVSGMCYTIMHI